MATSFKANYLALSNNYVAYDCQLNKINAITTALFHLLSNRTDYRCDGNYVAVTLILKVYLTVED